jgi:hypothetical protein
MNDNAKMAARYLARAFADYRVAAYKAHRNATPEAYAEYGAAIRALIDAQEISGVEMVGRKSLDSSNFWTMKMSGLVPA